MGSRIVVGQFSSRTSRYLLLAVVVACQTYLTGCNRSQTTVATNSVTVNGADGSSPPSMDPTFKPERSKDFVFDGRANDWMSIAPILSEVGRVGTEDDDSVDIKQLRVTNDDNYVYFFLHTEPSIRDRWRMSQMSSAFVEIYFDTDSDTSTGIQPGLAAAEYGFGGYERRIWMPIGVYQDTNDIAQPMMNVHVAVAPENGSFGLGFTVEWSREPNSLIQFGDDGVEFGVTLEVLGLQPGATIRLLICEGTLPPKEGHTEVSYKLE